MSDAVPVGHSIPERRRETQLIVDRLRATAVGETVSYEQLAQLTGCDIEGDERHLLASARRILEHEDRIVFGAVLRVGVKRLDDQGKVEIGAIGLDRARSAARLGARRLACVEHFDLLPQASQLRHNATMTLFRLFRHVTSRPRVALLEARLLREGATLPVQKTLELFAKRRKDPPQEEPAP